MAKEFVLGMEALLIANATEQFDSDNTVIIPMATIEELETYEGYPEETKNAKAVLKMLREIGINKLINEGFTQRNGSLLKVALDAPKEHNYKNKKAVTLPFSNLSNYDKRRFALCKYLQENKPDNIDNVILISMSDSTRLRADYLKIKAEEPKFRLFPVLEEQYSGQITLEVPPDIINKFYDKKKCNLSDLKLSTAKIPLNTFITLRDYYGHSALGIYNGTQVSMLYDSTINLTHGFKPLNKSQSFLLHALTASPSTIPIVIVKGAAGTGKTFCSLVAGFAQTKKLSWNNNSALYNRVLVSAPMLDEKVRKIGAVKGSLEEKLNPYTAGILDNANEILNFNKYFKYKGSIRNQNEDSKKQKRRNNNPELINTNPSASPTQSSLKPDVLRDIMDDGVFRIISLDLLRGRTFTNAYYIVDEAQNIRPEEIKTLLTRIGKGSKVILSGDPSQTDAKGLNERYNGLTYASELLKGKSFCYQIGFEEEESVRSPFVKEILKLF